MADEPKHDEASKATYVAKRRPKGEKWSSGIAQDLEELPENGRGKNSILFNADSTLNRGSGWSRGTSDK